MDVDGGTAIIPAETQLFAKMARVMGIINRVPKSGTNSFHKYRYATADDVADVIREALAEVNLAFIVQMGEVKQETIENTVDGKQKSTTRTTVKFTFTFACGDTGAVISSPWVGQVDDNSDKAINKCATSAEKYFLMKTFIVSAGDEPDADADKHTEAARAVASLPHRQWIPPKYAREYFEDPEGRKQFAALIADLNITDDKPYLAALGRMDGDKPLERYSGYPGKTNELIANMYEIHQRLNTPAEDDSEPETLPSDDNYEPGDTPNMQTVPDISTEDAIKSLNGHHGERIPPAQSPVVTAHDIPFHPDSQPTEAALKIERGTRALMDKMAADKTRQLPLVLPRREAMPFNPSQAHQTRSTPNINPDDRNV